MAVEILRHPTSGELYAVQYLPDAPAATEAIARICGPLTAAEAIEAHDDGDFANDDPEDIAWARSTVWQAVPSSALDYYR